VIVANCQHEKVQKNGRTPKGAIRYRCTQCGKSWTEETTALGGMRIGLDQAAKVVQMLCEGVSVSATVRLTGTSMNTILSLLNYVGERCESYMAENIKGVHVSEIQIDEQWQFILCKRATAKELKYVGGCGDSYTYTAIERGSKLIVAWHFGKRDEKHTNSFIKKLANATVGRFDLASDGWSAYPMAVWTHLGDRVDYGMLVKIYGDGTAEDRRRYSPAKIIEAKRTRVIGIPEKSKICTSHIERMNGSVRTFCKRMGRLTYCFSKKWNNHRNALALFFAYYNFCRPHKSLKGETPAMAHGLENHVWTVRELIENVSRSLAM
jgi:IS1 family transposase/transposase-like protein